MIAAKFDDKNDGQKPRFWTFCGVFSGPSPGSRAPGLGILSPGVPGTLKRR